MSDTDMEQKRKRAPFSSYVFVDSNKKRHVDERCPTEDDGAEPKVMVEEMMVWNTENIMSLPSSSEACVLDDGSPNSPKTCHCQCLDRKFLKLIP